MLHLPRTRRSLIPGSVSRRGRRALERSVEVLVSSSGGVGGDDANCEDCRRRRCGRARSLYYAAVFAVLLARSLLKLSVITVISPINRLARAAPLPLFDPTFPHIFSVYSTTDKATRTTTTPDPLVFTRRRGFRATASRYRDTLSLYRELVHAYAPARSWFRRDSHPLADSSTLHNVNATTGVGSSDSAHS